MCYFMYHLVDYRMGLTLVFVFLRLHIIWCMWRFLKMFSIPHVRVCFSNICVILLCTVISFIGSFSWMSHLSSEVIIYRNMLVYMNPAMRLPMISLSASMSKCRPITCVMACMFPGMRLHVPIYLWCIKLRAYIPSFSLLYHTKEAAP